MKTVNTHNPDEMEYAATLAGTHNQVCKRRNW